MLPQAEIQRSAWTPLVKRLKAATSGRHGVDGSHNLYVFLIRNAD